MKQLNWQSQHGSQQDWQLHGTWLCHLPVAHHMLPPFGFVLLSSWRETILGPHSRLGCSKSVCCPRSDALGKLRLKVETNLGSVVAVAFVWQNKGFFPPLLVSGQLWSSCVALLLSLPQSPCGKKALKLIWLGYCGPGLRNQAKVTLENIGDNIKFEKGRLDVELTLLLILLLPLVLKL